MVAGRKRTKTDPKEDKIIALTTFLTKSDKTKRLVPAQDAPFALILWYVAENIYLL